MQSTRVYKRYVKALFDTALEMNIIDMVFQDMQHLHELCNTDIEFNKFLESPIMHPKKKNAIIRLMFDGKLSNITINFIILLISKRREISLKGISSAYIDTYKEYKNILTITLKTPYSVSDYLKEELRKILAMRTGKSVEIINIEMPSLLGGFVIEGKGRMLDTSVKMRIYKLRKEFSKNTYKTQF